MLYINLKKYYIKLLIPLFFFIVLHGLILFFFKDLDLYKFSTSVIALVIIVYSGFVFGDVILNCKYKHIENSVNIIYYLLIIIGLTSSFFFVIWGEKMGGSIYIKPMFPFCEPSHFSLVFAPVALYKISMSKGWRKYIPIIIGIIIALIMHSLILIVICGLLLMIAMSVTYLVATLLILIALLLRVDYYSDRLPIDSGHHKNLSWLVYKQGWEQIILNMENTYGFGVGFNQLGVNFIETTSSKLIYAISGTNLNIFDGSFMLAKLLTEFGIFGLIILFYYIKYFKLSIKNINNLNLEHSVHLSLSFILAYCVEILFRGVGYFNSSLLLLTASIYILLAKKIN